MSNRKSYPGLARQQDWRRKALMRREEKKIERKVQQQLTPEDRQKAVQILKELFED